MKGTRFFFLATARICPSFRMFLLSFLFCMATGCQSVSKKTEKANVDHAEEKSASVLSKIRGSSGGLHGNHLSCLVPGCEWCGLNIKLNEVSMKSSTAEYFDNESSYLMKMSDDKTDARTISFSLAPTDSFAGYRLDFDKQTKKAILFELGHVFSKKSKKPKIASKKAFETSCKPIL